MDLHAIRHASRWAACVSLLLMLAIGGAKPAHGAGWDTPVTISDGTPNWLYPRVATRSGPGNYVHVVWRDLAATKVMYRRSADGGRTWFPILTLHTGTVASIGPHIATAGNTVHVVWEGPSSAIKYLRSTNNGGAWDAEVTLSGATTGYTPDIGASVDRVYVAWIKDGAPDIVYVQSQNNGNTWTTPANVTSDGNTTSESDVRVAASGTYAYFAWLQNGNVLFRNKTGVIWGFPITLWVGDSDHVSVAAYNERVFVDRNQAANGPVQRVSANWGGAFSPAVSLGTGDEKPEVSASRAYDGNGATAFLDTRLSVHRIFVSTSVASETQIATITGSSRNTDIGAMHEGSMHVVANSSGERHVYYHRYVAPRDFDWWQQLFGVSKSDVQWTDFDGDGDLDLVLSGDTSGSGNVLVTQTWENTFNVFVPLTLKQDLSLMPDFAGVRNESSGNLAWGDYDNDGDLDVFVGGMTTTVRIARIYENNGLGTLTHDAAQTLTAVSQSAAAWGDYDADGDLDLVVTGHDGTQSTATLYVNGAGTLTAHPSLTLVGLHGGSADWADWDGDGDLDLMLSGNSLIPPAAGVRKILFYENDGDGGLTDSGPKGLVGVSLSDAAFGDYDGDGDLDLLCTGDGTVTTPVRIFKIYSNDGTGVFTEVASPELIYRSSGAWGDYDNDGDLDVGLCGYTGTQLRTRIYENTGGAFSHATAYTFPGVRDGSITWADVNEDGRLDFFMTGWDFGGTTYAELYMNLGGDSNTPPTEPGTFTCTVVPGAGGMELGWSGASDGETATAGLYYALRVGTTPGGHEVFSGTYSTPLMGNVGQATAHVLDVPADTYYWSVVAIDSGFMASDWSAEQTCQFCPADLSGNGQADFADILVIIGAWGPCPTPCLEDLNGNDQVDFADILIVIGAWGACP